MLMDNNMRESVIKSKSEQPKFYHEALRFRGPVRRRSCTDIVWLVLFLLLIPSWGYVGFYSITSSNGSLLYEIFEQRDDNKTSDICGQDNNSSCYKLIQILQENTNAVVNSWKYLASGLLLTAVICCLYAILLRWTPTIIVWASIIEWLTLQGFSIVYLYKSYTKSENGNIWFLIGDGVVFILIIIMLVALRKKIKQAILLIKEGSKLVTAIKSTLLLPLFLGIVIVGVFIYGIIVALYISFGDLTSQFSSKVIVYSLYGADIFSLLWAWLFINCMADIIFASLFSSWYWKRDKKKIPMFILFTASYRIIRYHFGTIALGSLLLSIVRGIRWVAEIINKISQYAGATAEFLGNFLRWFCWLMDEYVTYINKNALIMCSLQGTNFYKSARDASNLIVSNAATSIVLDKLVDYIFFFNKLLISISMGLGIYIVQHSDTVLEPPTWNDPSFTPCIVLGLTVFFITSLFFNAYIMAVDTIYLCYVHDRAVNDGSERRPYLMTENMKKIFEK